MRTSSWSSSSSSLFSFSTVVLALAGRSTNSQRPLPRAVIDPRLKKRASLVLGNNTAVRTRAWSFSLNETFFSAAAATALEETRRKRSRRRASRRRYVSRRLSSPCFRRGGSPLGFFVIAGSLLSLSLFLFLSCSRSVDINPGQGGKNVRFGQRLSSGACGGTRSESGRQEKEQFGEKEKERGRRVDDACFAVVDISVLSVPPPCSRSLSLSLFLLLVSSFFIVRYLALSPLYPSCSTDSSRASPRCFDQALIFSSRRALERDGGSDEGSKEKERARKGGHGSG